jgi:EAL domain-containing protein (putative c-di-GMP-specific phosphodiesterase class I)
MSTEPAPPRVLLVDDEEAILRIHTRALTKAGFSVVSATDGIAAEAALREASFDLILSDIDMPGMDGLTLLKRVRDRDLDVPVILITGVPSFDAAVKAVESGALRYLVKPVELKTLVALAHDAVRLHQLAKAKREALELAGGADHFIGDQAGRAAAFERALEGLHVAYQPIVSWSGRSVYAFEALLRSGEPSLPHPGAVLEAAERLGRVHELGRKIRARAIEPLATSGDALLFLNLHPTDLADDELYDESSPLARVASRVVLEITERASLDGIKDVRDRVAVLRRLGFRIAIDDLGAGYAGLTSLSALEPDVVKLDMALVRDLHLQPTKQTLVRTMIKMCGELGMTVTAEGIEVTEERDELARAGCDLMQGYFFARPGPAFPTPTFG